MMQFASRSWQRIFTLAALAVFIAWGTEGCGKTETANTDAKPAQAAKNRPVVVIGRVPSGNPLDMLEKMEPLIGYLQDKLEITVKPEFAKDYAEFTAKMVENENYDIAFCAPLQYVAAHEKAGYEAVLRPVRYNADTYVGIIITAKPEIKKLADLKGKSVAFVDPNSTSGFLFPLGLLGENGVGLKDIKHKFLDGHDNVVLNVLAKDFDAGAVFEDAHKQYGKERANQITVIGKTDPIYNEPIAMSPTFMKEHPELAKKFIEAMTSLTESEAGKNALKDYDKNVNRFVEADDEDYASVMQYKKRLPPEILADIGIN